MLARAGSARMLAASLGFAVVFSVAITTALAGFGTRALPEAVHQRLASAPGTSVALAGGPRLLIADEPTSQPDLETGRQIMRLLLTVVRSEQITALVATHDEALVDLADEVLRLEDGQITSTAPAR